MMIKSNMQKPKPRGYWKRVIEEWQASGEAISTFCKTRALNKSTFYYWYGQFKLKPIQAAQALEPVTSRPSFLPIECEESPVVSEGGEITLYYPNGCYIVLKNGFDEALFKKLHQAIRI
jgi:hypothetical protein